MHETGDVAGTSGDKPGDGKKADDVHEESDEGATAAGTHPTLPTTEEVDGVGLLQYLNPEWRAVDMPTTEEVDGVGSQPYFNPVLNDLLAIDPSIPSSTESKSSTGRGPTMVM